MAFVQPKIDVLRLVLKASSGGSYSFRAANGTSGTIVSVHVPKRSREGPPTLPFIQQGICRAMQVEGWCSIAPASAHVLFSSVSAFLKPSSINEQVFTVPITFWFACKLLQTDPLQAIYIHNIWNSSFSSSWPWLLSLLLLLHNLIFQSHIFHAPTILPSLNL